MYVYTPYGVPLFPVSMYVSEYMHVIYKYVMCLDTNRERHIHVYMNIYVYMYIYMYMFVNV